MNLLAICVMLLSLLAILLLLSTLWLVQQLRKSQTETAELQKQTLSLVGRLSNLILSKDALTYSTLQAASDLANEPGEYVPARQDHTYGLEGDDYVDNAIAYAEDELQLGTAL